MHVFLSVHPFGECFSHLVRIIVEIFAIHGFSDIDPDLPPVESVQRMRVLGCSRPDLVCAGDIDGDKRNACLDGKIGSSVLKLGELAGMSSCSFREYEADVALFNFFFSLDETSDGVAVTVYCDSAAYTHDKAAELAVLCLQIGSGEAAHPLKVTLRQIVDDENAVWIALMV